MLPVSVALSSDMFTIGRIAYRREGVSFPTENALSAGKGDGSAQRVQTVLSTIASLVCGLYRFFIQVWLGYSTASASIARHDTRQMLVPP